MGDGVEIILDVWDLNEGDDKYAFMERMVTEESVTNVLVFSDAAYAKKADSREAGVGTESQIISQEIYDKVQQSKFIPVICELDEAGEPCLPVFLRSRVWIDFSTPEAANENWERLVRCLYGKPAQEKPTIGKPPAYLLEGSSEAANPAIRKLVALRQAVQQGKSSLSLYRRDFIDACVEYADALRVREQPDLESLGQRVLEDCGKLKTTRDLIVDWVLLEAENPVETRFEETLLSLLEKLLDLKSRPPELNSWNEVWFEAHSIFVYETFLYVVAALIRANAFDLLHTVLTSSYLLPERSAGASRFAGFDAFYGYSKTLQSVLAPKGQRLYSPAAALIKRQADRGDISFAAVIEAEALVLLMALITSEARWYPQTLFYARHSGTPNLFLRATQHRHFQKIATVTGITDANALRDAVREGHQRLEVARWPDFVMSSTSFWDLLNMDELDTRK